MLSLLNNIILIQCNLAPDLFPLCQVWLKTSPRGEGRPFILPAELGGILAHFYKNLQTILRYPPPNLLQVFSRYFL
jgi:hypothetical protein